MNNFLIYACFSRSLDKYHVSNNKIHLISSIVGSCDNLHVVENFILNNSIIKINIDSNIFIFVIFDTRENLTKHYDSFNFKENNKIFITESTSFTYEIRRGSLIIRYLTIEAFLYNSFLVSNIFGLSNLQAKDFDSVHQNSLFVFHNII